MADLLKWHHATVTTCHSKTKDLPDVVCTRQYGEKAIIDLEYFNIAVELN